MFGLDKLFDKEKATRETITDTLSDIAQELNAPFNEFFIMIKPKNEKFEHNYLIYRSEKGKAPVFVREITLNEILNGKEE